MMQQYSGQARASPKLKENSILAEKLYCDLLYDQQSKKITKNKAMSQLKGVKSIFESVSKVI